MPSLERGPLGNHGQRTHDLANVNTNPSKSGRQGG